MHKLEDVTVVNREGQNKKFDKTRIENALKMACNSTGVKDVNQFIQVLTDKIASRILIQLNDDKIIHLKDIESIVELSLIDSNKPEVARAYISFRSSRRKEIKHKNKPNQLLTNEFISKYKHIVPPMTEIGAFTYYRTYSRWLETEKRREFWYETVRRAVEYNCGLVPDTTKKEAEELFDAVFNLKQFISSRTLWTGGTKAAKTHGMSNFNCSFKTIDETKAFTDIFHILMVGSGAGFRILPEDVAKLPKFKQNILLTEKPYDPLNKMFRQEYTSLEFPNNYTVAIIVGDSKVGWEKALEFYLEILTNRQYSLIKTIVFDYNNVRPKGEKLLTFGGTASGHTNLRDMFSRIDKVINSEKCEKDLIKLRPIHCLDITNSIAYNVVAGGVRRSAQIALISPEDQECIHAKDKLYTQDDQGEWGADESLLHRSMSNNSIFYESKPTDEQLAWHFNALKTSGEPGFANAEAGRSRRADYAGGNPCFEIALRSEGMCNLSEVNVLAYVDEDTKELNMSEVIEAQKRSARAGYRMTFIDLELPSWDNVQKEDRLLGCSLTGWQDMVNLTGMTKSQESKVLNELRDAVHAAGKDIANHYKTPEPLLSTTVKPSGTISLLPTVSPGVHMSHSPYYIRRVRVSSSDPLLKACEELEYPIFPENGQDMETGDTKVVEFPVKAPEGRTKYDVSAIEQLETYKRFQEEYVDHNTSITVHVRNEEWDEVEEWVRDHWNTVVGVSFLSLDDHFYPLAPYEACTKEEYEKRLSEMKPFSPALVNKYENGDDERELESSCEGGACPVR